MALGSPCGVACGGRRALPRRESRLGFGQRGITVPVPVGGADGGGRWCVGSSGCCGDDTEKPALFPRPFAHHHHLHSMIRFRDQEEQGQGAPGGGLEAGSRARRKGGRRLLLLPPSSSRGGPAARARAAPWWGTGVETRTRPYSTAHILVSKSAWIEVVSSSPEALRAVGREGGGRGEWLLPGHVARCGRRNKSQSPCLLLAGPAIALPRGTSGGEERGQVV